MPTIPFTLPEKLRNQHMHVVGGSGHGKTQSLQYLIAQDIKAGHGVIVIDSQGDLIKKLSRLEIVKDRLVLIDPSDVQFPVALNLFSFGRERFANYTTDDRKALLAQILALMDFVMASLLGAALTSKQQTAFRFVVRVMMLIPGATVITLLKFMQDHEPYRHYIDQLTGAARMFFEDDEGYAGSEFVKTRKEVIRRLYAILENETFFQLFNSPVSKLDLFQEMNAGKVILISTDKRLLQPEGCTILGRFFICMIMQAANERAVVPAEDRKRCYVYIDECQDYIDNNISLMLEQVRKYEVGLVLAHQYLAQVSHNILASLAANTAIKMVGGTSADDTKRLAAQMKCEPEFIEKQKPLSFAVSLRGQGTLSLRFPYGHVEGLPQLSEPEFQLVRDNNRTTYCTPFAEPATAPAPKLPGVDQDKKSSIF